MIGVVLAGGASSRFGGRPKGLIEFNGVPMARRSAQLLCGLCDQVVIEAPAGVGYEVLGLPLIYAAPAHAGKGPLAGMAAALAVAMADEHVAFAPCDMPLLSEDIYRQLAREAASKAGAYAATATGVEPLVAVLAAQTRAFLLEVLKERTMPRTHAVLDRAGAVAVKFAEATAFANVNTPEDLARLQGS